MALADRLPVDALIVDPVTAARRLLGCHLVLGDVVLRIVETEAYGWPDDTASHARAGITARNSPMWGPAGHAYVYLCYGIHHLLNVTTGRSGEAGAVLVRGCEVVAGHEQVRGRRGGRMGRGALAGPGKVAAALGVDISWSHHPLLTPGGLELHDGAAPTRVAVGPRVGIDHALPAHRDAPWRFADADSDQVSHRKGLSVGRR